MSRSNYAANTTEDRDYESRRDRERERSRAADRFDDSETRHHGKWTASSETVDLEGSGAPRRSLSRKESREDRREDRDHDREFQSRSRGSSSFYGNDGSYGIPTPPPQPPTNFYEPHGSYRQSHNYGSSSRGYGSGYGESQYGQSSYHPSSYGHSAYGSHPSYYGSSYGSGYHPSSYGSHPSYGYGSHPSSYGSHPSYYSGYGSAYDHLNYGSSGYGSGYGHSLSSYGQQHPSLLGGVHPIHYAFLQQQQQHGLGANRSRGLGGLGGLGQHHESQYGHHQPTYSHHENQGQFLGFHQPRPHADIYEIGNDYIIELDMPGHARDHVDIKLSGNELLVISKPPKRDYNWHVNERALGRHDVERKFYLPADVNSAGIAPVLANGVLRLTLPRHATTTSTLGSSVGSAVAHPRTSTTTDTTTTTTATTQAVNL